MGGGADVEEGGETSFTQSRWLNETAQRHGQPSECARNRVFVKPSKVREVLPGHLRASEAIH